MKRFSEQFYKKSTSVKLAASERTELRERLVSYMEYHPLPAELKVKKSKTERIKSEAYKMVQIPYGLIARTSLAMAVVTLVVVPVMAEQAMPGDALYAVKVQFNEELRSTLTFDSYEKVEWETERLNRRIAEARLLASEGRLTEEVEAEVAQAVRTHSENAQRSIADIRAVDVDGAMIASIGLDTILEVQSASLREATAEDIGTKPKANVLADTVSELSVATKSVGTSSIPGYEKLMARVEQNTTRIYELRDSISGLVQAENINEINRRISDLERSIAEAIDVATEEEDKITSRKTLVDALQRSQKLIVFMTQLEVYATVDIEELIPMVLTTEEESDQIKAWNAEIVEKRGIAAGLLVDGSQAGSEDLIVKVEGLLTEVDAMVGEIGTSTEFESIEASATSVIGLLDEVLEALGYEIDEEADGAEDSTEEPAETPETSTTTDETFDTDQGTTTNEVELPIDTATDTPSTTVDIVIGTGTVDTE